MKAFMNPNGAALSQTRNQHRDKVKEQLIKVVNRSKGRETTTVRKLSTSPRPDETDRTDPFEAKRDSYKNIRLRKLRLKQEHQAMLDKLLYEQDFKFLKKLDDDGQKVEINTKWKRMLDHTNSLELALCEDLLNLGEESPMNSHVREEFDSTIRGKRMLHDEDRSRII
jgi:hypothetical protein